jgi:peptidyl-prolyl cis-trans isomerase A (cyclophilin A)
MKFPAISVPGTGDLYARLVTTQGTMVLALHEKLVPNTVANFVGLAMGTVGWREPKTGKDMTGTSLYNGVRFHRVIPNFMIQCGDPISRYNDDRSKMRWGTGGPGYEFEDEFVRALSHDGPGILSMANAGPGTNGSQWFITEKATTFLDGKHTVFGKVVVGLENVGKIARVKTVRDCPVEDVILERIEIFRSETCPTS